MTSLPSTASLLNSVEQAEKDLALYAAIIGFKPSVDPSAPTPYFAEQFPPAESAAPFETADDSADYSADKIENSDQIGQFEQIDHAEPATSHPHHTLHLHMPIKLSHWMRHMSDEAKKRIHEAKMRLAS